MRRSGITTLSTSAWVSIPNGPSARVEHTISGPFTNRKGSSAASRPRVTASFEFGLTTRIRRWGAFIGLLAGDSNIIAMFGRVARVGWLGTLLMGGQDPPATAQMH